MLKINNIYKKYSGKNILSDISFTISENEKIALVGTNGVGKTTLLRIIAGLETPDSGKILVNRGKKIASRRNFLLF